MTYDAEMCSVLDMFRILFDKRILNKSIFSEASRGVAAAVVGPLSGESGSAKEKEKGRGRESGKESAGDARERGEIGMQILHYIDLV